MFIIVWVEITLRCASLFNCEVCGVIYGFVYGLVDGVVYSVDHGLGWGVYPRFRCLFRWLATEDCVLFFKLTKVSFLRPKTGLRSFYCVIFFNFFIVIFSVTNMFELGFSNLFIRSINGSFRKIWDQCRFREFILISSLVSLLKQLLETLFLSIKKCTGFTRDAT